MKSSNKNLLNSAPHLDTVNFKAAIEYTSRITGFRTDLIEKDYYCSLALAFLFSEDTPLIFRGGTCLNKVHVGFYRLSEDLDFSVPVDLQSSRSERRNAVDTVKKQLRIMSSFNLGVNVDTEFIGHNEGRQYTSNFSYKSIALNRNGNIKFEVGLREPILDFTIQAQAGTLLRDPFKKTELLSGLKVSCLSVLESFSEKIRAALTRRDPAIRDLFDLDYALRNVKINLNDTILLGFVEQKLKVPGTYIVELSTTRIELFRKQLSSELKPVLRPDDYKAFDFDRAIAFLRELHRVASTLKA